MTGTYDGTAQTWDAATGRPQGPPRKHQGRVMAVAFSPDGRILSTGGAVEEMDPQKPRRILGGEVQLGETTTGRPLATPLAHPAPVWAVAFSPDGHTLLTGCRDQRARFFASLSGALLGEPLLHEGTVPAVTFSPDGRTALAASAGGNQSAAARLWEVPRRPELGIRVGPRSPITDVAFSPDGRHLLAGSGDGTARLWDLTMSGVASAPRVPGPVLHHDGPVAAVAFSPDGRAALTGSHDQTAQPWDVATGQPRGSALQHDSAVAVVAFSPDGRSVLTGCVGGARLWDATTGQPRGPLLPYGGSVALVAFSPDGQMFLFSSSQWVHFWKTSDYQPLTDRRVNGPKQGGCLASAFSPDGETVVTGSGTTAQLWDRATGRLLRAWQNPQSLARACFSPDGKTLLLTGREGAAQFWEVATGQPQGAPLVHQPAPVADAPGSSRESLLGAAFSPDSRTVLTRSADRTAQLWDTATGKPLGPPLPHPAAVSALALHPDGRRMATGSVDGTIRLWAVPAPVTGEVERLRLWIEVLTGME